MSLFEKASRQKVRFQSAKGLLSVEDLWDLPLSQLDTIAKAQAKYLRDTEGEQSFIPGVKAKPNAIREQTELAFEIVKHVIAVLVAEKDARENAKARADQKQKLLALLAEKDDADLKSKSREEIEKMIAEL